MVNPIDKKERDLAINPAISFAVTAPAGSGKTSLLTQRVLSLLSICESPEEVVSITFTRKACAEMLHRISAALNFGSADLPVDATENETTTWNLARKVIERDVIKGWGLLENTSRLRVTTIDGLCRSIASQMPLESGLGGVPNTLDMPKTAYERAARNVFRHLESDDADMARDFEVFFSHLDNDFQKAEALLSQLLMCRDQWLPHIFKARYELFRDVLDDAYRGVVADALQNLKNRLAPVECSLVPIVQYAADNLQAEGSDSLLAMCSGVTSLPSADSSGCSQWKGIVDLFVTGANEWRKSADKRVGMIAGVTKDEKIQAKEKKQEWSALSEAIQALGDDLLVDLEVVRLLPENNISDMDWQFIGALSRVLPLCVAELDLVFKELGGTDFTSITLGAINALGGDSHHSDLALRLDHTIHHILCDEFQDTASIQLKLLVRLTEGWERGDGKTLFLVGDCMQGIYSFRNANVSIFMNVRNGFFPNIDIVNLDLKVNFRSHEGVVSWVNNTFSKAFPQNENVGRGAVTYSDSVAFKPLLEDRAVTCHLVEDTSARKGEAERVVEIVRECRKSNPDEKIAILVRSRNHLKEVFKAMKDASIQWSANEIEPLSSRPAIVDVMSLVRALTNLNDRIAWLAVLRAPWAALTLKDLDVLVNASINENHVLVDGYRVIYDQLCSHKEIDGLSDDAKVTLERIAPIFIGAVSQRRRKSLRDTVEGLWYALGGPSTLEVESDLINTKTFFDLLDKYDTSSQLESLAEFNQAVEKLYAVPVSNADKNLVVMSLHAAKGLEFTNVIIVGLDRASRSDDKDLLIWHEDVAPVVGERLLMASLSAAGEDDSTFYKYLRFEKSLRNKFENNRLLYVGCTRAIKRLHLVAVSTRKEDGSWNEPSSGSLLSSIWNTFVNEAEIVSCSGSVIGGTFKNLEAGNLKKVVINRVPDLVGSELLNKYRGKSLKKDDLNMPETSGFWQRNEKIIGTVIHRNLCFISIVGLGHWGNNKTAGDTIRRQLKHEGFVGNTDKTIEKIQRVLEIAAGSSDGKFILDNSIHSEANSEIAYLVKSGTEVERRIIDRTFVDSDNVRWIVDYKSSSPSDNESKVDFLSGEVTKYRSQLRKYKEIFLGEGRAIKTALYFPVLGEMVLC